MNNKIIASWTDTNEDAVRFAICSSRMYLTQAERAYPYRFIVSIYTPNGYGEPMETIISTSGISNRVLSVSAKEITFYRGMNYTGSAPAFASYSLLFDTEFHEIYLYHYSVSKKINHMYTFKLPDIDIKKTYCKLTEHIPQFRGSNNGRRMLLPS